MSPFARNALASLILVPILIFFGWILSGAVLDDEEFLARTPKKEIKTVSLGWDRRSGNFLIVQLDFKPEYFTREDRLRAFLEEPLNIAKEKGWLQKSTLVVYPPEIGNYLFLTGSRREILESGTETSAWDLHFLFRKFSPDSLRFLLSRKENLELQISKESLEKYERVFSALAKMYEVQILAGSICLPSPTLKDSKISIQLGAWEERAYIFDTDGKILDGSLLRTKPRGEVSGTQNSPPQVWVANLNSGRAGILFSEDLKSPELEEAVKKTYVGKWIGLGSVEDEGKFKEWIKNSSFESGALAEFSGKAWDYEFPGKSFAKTRYGSPEPLEGQKGNLLINIYL